ncbi:hypothetical protein Daus18300_003004 [Diaporthe australafricana]|uniref:Uncharacterized protein n=1 Tax=Diaporthe australafricana TaxID=127596 RepID=A0ABR3XIN9_9PEZI
MSALYGVFATDRGFDFGRSHIRATGSFGFVLTPAGKEATIKDLVNILYGHGTNPKYPGPINGDLTEFDFNEVIVNAPIESQMDGCRDWIAQAFTRFYLMGLVTLCGQALEDTPALYENQLVTYHNFNQAIPNRASPLQPAPFWFPGIIDKKFKMTPTKELPHGVTVEPIRMWRGRFHDRDVTRLETVNVCTSDMSQQFTFRYNYHEPSRPTSSGRPSGGPPPSRGPGGRSDSGGGSGSRGGSGSGGRSGPSSNSSSGVTSGNRPTGETKSANSGGQQQPHAGTGARKVSGGGTTSGAAPAAPKAQSWISVKVDGVAKGMRDANAKPDQNGWVAVYDSQKQRKGYFNVKANVYKAA